MRKFLSPFPPRDTMKRTSLHASFMSSVLKTMQHEFNAKVVFCFWHSASSMWVLMHTHYNTLRYEMFNSKAMFFCNDVFNEALEFLEVRDALSSTKYAFDDLVMSRECGSEPASINSQRNARTVKAISGPPPVMRVNNGSCDKPHRYNTTQP